jgi:putative pyruvate formate lyase activating enzyme
MKGMDGDWQAALSDCHVCPRECGVNRLRGEKGACGVGADAVVASRGPHFGEEPPLVGRGGSGTIFFSGCSLHCLFCQNYDISHQVVGVPASPARIADWMLELEGAGCHNINFVTPTHVTPQVLAAVRTARDKGLSVPTVYNCGGYEKVETLASCDGLIDIYMPDTKFADCEAARQLASAPDYPEVMRAAVREMHGQVGDLVIEEGLARRGLLVRHLVMPGGLEAARAVIDFLAEEISPRTYINVMGQYRPVFRAREAPAINRRPTAEEYLTARSYALERGLRLAE